MIEKGGGFVEYIPADQVVAREQYLDFFVGRWFHETLFCRADVKLERHVDPQRARDFYISAQMRSRESGRATDLKAALDAIRRAGDGPAEERMPLVAAALQYLDSVWPQAVDFSTLVAAAGRIVAQEGGAAAEPHMVEGLASDLYQAYRAERIQLLIEPPKLVTVSGERPVASFLAREQALVGPIVTNLRHETIRLDGLLRPFVMLMDGTRDIDALAPLLTELLAAQPVDVEAGETPVGPPQSPEEARERVTQALEMVGKLGLLEE
jgi:methyltransferase-like protein